MTECAGAAVNWGRQRETLELMAGETNSFFYVFGKFLSRDDFGFTVTGFGSF